MKKQNVIIIAAVAVIALGAAIGIKSAADRELEDTEVIETELPVENENGEVPSDAQVIEAKPHEEVTEQPAEAVVEENTSAPAPADEPQELELDIYDESEITPEAQTTDTAMEADVFDNTSAENGNGNNEQSESSDNGGKKNSGKKSKSSSQAAAQPAPDNNQELPEGVTPTGNGGYELPIDLAN